MEWTNISHESPKNGMIYSQQNKPQICFVYLIGCTAFRLVMHIVLKTAIPQLWTRPWVNRWLRDTDLIPARNSISQKMFLCFANWGIRIKWNRLKFITNVLANWSRCAPEFGSMTWRLLGAKLFASPVKPYCQFDSWEQAMRNLNQNAQLFH